VSCCNHSTCAQYMRMKLHFFPQFWNIYIHTHTHTHTHTLGRPQACCFFSYEWNHVLIRNSTAYPNCGIFVVLIPWVQYMWMFQAYIWRVFALRTLLSCSKFCNNNRSTDTLVIIFFISDNSITYSCYKFACLLSSWMHVDLNVCMHV